MRDFGRGRHRSSNLREGEGCNSKRGSRVGRDLVAAAPYSRRWSTEGSNSLRRKGGQVRCRRTAAEGSSSRTCRAWTTAAEGTRRWTVTAAEEEERAGKGCRRRRTLCRRCRPGRRPSTPSPAAGRRRPRAAGAAGSKLGETGGSPSNLSPSRSPREG